MQPLRVTTADLVNLEKDYCRRSLANFVKRAWHVLEPQTELKWGWALDALALHLEAVTRGALFQPRLLANVPPGTMKSLMTSVFWPSWEWGPMGLPWKRNLATSHALSLAHRDSGKFRSLITSNWYQSLWPIKIVKDTESLITNSETGFREATAFSGMTGKRGDNVVLDDPLSAEDANSPAELRKAEIRFRETLQTRLNDTERSAIVVIMQRLHEKDTSGVIIENKMPYTHLMLPMRYERDRHCETWGFFNGNRVRLFSDPRKCDGELLFPERFPEPYVAQLEKDLGSYATAGQLQQRPAPRGGGIIKREWLDIREATPARIVWCRAWDLAATDDSDDAAYTVGVKIGRDAHGEFWVADVRRARTSPEGTLALLRQTAALDGPFIKGSIPQDPGQAGKAQAQFIIKMLAGFPYTSSPETGSKEARAMPFAAQCEAGNVHLLKGEWNEDYVSELETFPVGKFKDQVDATTRGFAELIAAKSYPLEDAMQ